MKTRLFYKIIGLVLLPLIVGLICAGFLLHQLNELEDKVRAFSIVNHLASLEDSVFKVAQGLGQLAFADDPVLHQKFYLKYERVVGRLPVLMDSLENDLTPVSGRSATPLQRQALEEVRFLKQIYPSIRGIVDEGAEQLRDGKSSKDTFLRLHPMISDYKHQLQDIQKVAEQLTGFQEGDSHKIISQLQNAEHNVMLMATVFALVAGGSTVYAARTIETRLRRIRINTDRLAQRQKLDPNVGGSDEITQLGTILYNASESIYEYERKEQERITAKQEFMQMISHDLRTPLTSIQLFLDLLGQGAYGEVSEKAQAKTKVADANAQRLLKLVNDLLEIERIESGLLKLVLAKCSSANLIERAVASVKTLADAQSIAISVSNFDHPVIADGDRIVQVMVNLLGNAIKFSQPETTVTVATTVTGGGMIRFSITDQGRGIPEEHLDSVFARFQQVDKDDATKKKGTGLGLAICKSIVEQSGGAIGVDSKPGGGSTFWFTLPQS